MPGDNDDDFMNDVSSVVAHAEVAPIGTNVIDDPDFEFKSEVKDSADTSDAVLDLVDTPEEKLARKEAKEKAKQEKVVDTKQDDKKLEQETQQQQQQQQNPDQKQKPQTAYMDRFLKQDTKGNLVLADGTVIASNGISRSYYEGLKQEARNHRDVADKLALSNSQLANKFAELHTKYSELKNNSGITSVVKETGMTHSEVQEGLRLMKSYKANPIEAIKSLLTQARMSGIDLSSIGINGGIDPATIARAIADAKDAQQQTHSQQTDAEKSQQSTEKMVDEFFARNPEALNFVDEIAGAAEKYPNESLDTIWYMFKMWKRQQDALQSEQEFNTQSQPKPQQQQQQQPQQQIKRLINTPRQYGTMSIDEIAASVKKDLLNG